MTCPQEGQRIVRPDGMCISSAPISGGYAVWQDNVRPLTELCARLNANKVEMECNKKKLQDAYLVQRSLHELTEKNRIYNELEAKHSRQTAQMRQMLARCEKSEPAERRRLLKKVLLLGTYIKRSANLYFLSSEYQWLPQQEPYISPYLRCTLMTLKYPERIYHRIHRPFASAQAQHLSLTRLLLGTG